jgi:hypothetical protein
LVASFTVNRTCFFPASVLMLAVSTHGRVAIADCTLAGQVAQVMPGTLYTTWFGPSVGMGELSTGPHPASTRAATATPHAGSIHVRMIDPRKSESPHRGLRRPPHF